jgi:hypothetical protein
MMQKPKAAGSSGNRSSSETSLASPSGGWNALNTIASMPPNDAFLLDNLVAGPNNVYERSGCINWATGLPGPVQSIVPYNSAAKQQLFAISEGAIYDITATGTVGAPVVSGLSFTPWQHVNFGTPGGQFLIIVNGVDSPYIYDGTTWHAISNTSTPYAITGVDPKTFINVQIFGNTLWFVQKATLSTWFLPVLQIAGAASQIDFTSLFRRGGSLIAMGDWTIDAGFGMFDNAVFITSEGEVAIYHGTDPTNANNWALIGLYRIGAPIGYRCMLKYGSDLLIINQDGLMPLSQALLSSRVSTATSLSNKIQGAISNATSLYGNQFGWQVELLPAQNLLILNVPVSGQLQQYVMNTLTNSWCRFLGWNAYCFELFQNNLYFGDNGTVKLAWQGNTDAGIPITCEVITAFTGLGTPKPKKLKMARPIFNTDSTSIALAIGASIDYDVNSYLYPITTTPTSQALWDTALWDNSVWGNAFAVAKDWETLQGIGRTVALHMKFSAQGSSLQWSATDVIFEVGDGL